MEKFLPDALIQSGIDHVYDYGPLAEQTVVLVPAFVHGQVEALCEASGFDKETLSYLLGMLLCYPLGLIMLMLPSGKVKHAFSFILGVFLLQFTIGKQWVHHLLTSLVVYVMLLLLPPKVSKTAVPVFTMLYMTLGHLHRQYINYLGWDLDFTGTQMVLTMKLYSLAYNIYDGHLIAAGKQDRAAKKCADLSLTAVPGIIEYLGYAFNFSTILAGPAFEYKIYADACDGINLIGGTKKPSNIWPTLKPFLTSIVCLGMFSVGNGMYPLLDPDDPQGNSPVVITDEFLAKPWLHRYLYTWVALFFIRQKYYFAWKNAEGACNIWYGGFEGYDEKGQEKGWENSNNVDAIAFETAQNVKTLSGAWNKKTANWLGRYVYIRTGGSLFATYSLSAFWHGFYPGYYLFFLTVPFMTVCERMGRKKLTPRFSTGKKWDLYGILCFLVTSLIVEYAVIAFQLLALDWAWGAWKSHYFFGHILSLVFYLVLSNVPSPKVKSV